MNSFFLCLPLRPRVLPAQQASVRGAAAVLTEYGGHQRKGVLSHVVLTLGCLDTEIRTLPTDAAHILDSPGNPAAPWLSCISEYGCEAFPAAHSSLRP